MTDLRSTRIRGDRQLMQSLADQNDWLVLSSGTGLSGQADSLLVEICGIGLAEGGPAPDQFTTGDRHRILIEYPAEYPNVAPRLTITTPVFHPNITPDGVIAMSDIGIAWHPDLTLDIVVERLWDLIRCATLDVDRFIHGAAARWFATQTELKFPLDPRSLSGDRPMENVVRYRSKTRRRQIPRQTGNEEKFMIDDHGDGPESNVIHIIE